MHSASSSPTLNPAPRVKVKPNLPVAQNPVVGLNKTFPPPEAGTLTRKLAELVHDDGLDLTGATAERTAMVRAQAAFSPGLALAETWWETSTSE